MTEIGNLEKRIKRQVLGKTRAFFVSTLPGVEHLCLDELLQLGLSVADARMSRGGIEFDGRVHDCYLANLYLRTANRVLMRLASFTASNFRQLEKKLTDLPWELYLQSDADISVNVTSKNSRLIHTDAIADRFKNSLDNRLRLLTGVAGKNHNSPTVRSQQIFVRAENDLFTVSIDSSGELLHKRGLKTQGGKAPVRETVAAAILQLAGYQPGETLIDPMCGTGTFSLEAAMVTGNIPAGWYRDFAFMDWPGFKVSRWNHLRQEAEKRMTPVSKPSIFASDIDPENCRALGQVIREKPLSETIHVFSADFFQLTPQDIKRQLPENNPGLVVLNPPFGLRLGTKDTTDQLFTDICQKLKQDFKGWKAAMLCPDKHLLKKIPFKATTHDFFHGGLHITLATGKIS